MKALAGLCCFYRLSRRICFLAFSGFQRRPTFLGSWPSFIFKASNGSQVLLTQHCIALTDPDSPAFLFLLEKSLWLHWAHWVTSPSSGQLIDNLKSICSLHCPLPCRGAYSQVPGLRMWMSLGAHHAAHHNSLSAELTSHGERITTRYLKLVL